MIAPSDTVNISLPPPARPFPLKGGLLYFSVHLLHLNSCMENFLRFPFISLSRCFSMTSLATSAASTALILSASSIWPFSLSSIDGMVLYEEHFTPLRSEEHTSELQSQFHLVCRLLLEKKK